MISVTEIQISADVSADLFTVPAVISERSEDLNTGTARQLFYRLKMRYRML
mgnify:CR=1 FL=1